MVKVEVGRSIRSIHKELLTELGDMVDEYFHIDYVIRGRGTFLWPDNVHWIACYAVTGGSEGHYIHVDLIDREDKRTLVFLGKTFLGMQHAQNIAARCAELLGA